MNQDEKPKPSLPIPTAEGEGEQTPIAVATGAGRPEPESDLPDIPASLPLLPVRDAVAYPSIVLPISVGRTRSKRVLDLALAGSRMIGVVTQRSAQVEEPRLGDLFRVGTACVIVKMFKTPEGTDALILHGVCRVGIVGLVKEDEYLEATVQPLFDSREVTTEIEALMHSVRTAAERMIELSPQIPDEARLVLRGVETPGALADFLAANLPLDTARKQELLETLDVTTRLRQVHAALANHLEVLELSHKIQDQVRHQIDDSQREYYLREQMKVIQKELGDKDARTETVDRLRTRLEAAKLPEPARVEARRELERLENIPPASPEYSMTLDYLEWMADLPWSATTEDNLDLVRARRILDDDHYGLEEVKDRIIQFLAVRRLKPDSRGPILCFAGPPGVGKTSLGQSIARALERKFVRISLGGIRDEATIRGHRRTYIGSLPGNIIRELRKAGSRNPLFMLDEVDKIGQDVRGDPMAALLEVLDPAQNSTFVDHYLNVAFDLSSVLFIGTANYLGAIEPALRDRMEVIELSGYTQREKLHIARRHLLPRQLSENGLRPEQLELSDDVIEAVVAGWTREAGVRNLERQLATLCRLRATELVRGDQALAPITVERLPPLLGPAKFESEIAARQAVPGVVTGLAFTPTGGEILFIEASVMPGTGQLKLTGQLGDVMRESALAAHSLIRSRSKLWHLPADFFRLQDLHVHVPAGATPKDGPSAGLAMLTAMMSILTQHGVDPATGMTGEITLSGRVLPIGGVREKVLAAHRAGLRRVILPYRNQPDLQKVPEEVAAELKFVFVRTIDEVLDLVLPDARKRPHRQGTSRAAQPRATARRKPTARTKKPRTRR
ncbi:MAG TPA: endopeptidase La [Phycisphaerae bacterium]|nr:endopeptidase La [Phycisphaerae bacterium]HNU45778.1 endopeptidase La [Phycisphaerae bacterium]